jgi:DNA polymerase-3 subunit epsilon
MDFVALDVETANGRSGSICSIGLARFCDGVLKDELYSLIKPPVGLDEFNYYCTRVHGITPDDVCCAPTFAAAYCDIETFIGERLLVSHNAPFDSRHLHAAMDRVDAGRVYQFACTLALSRRFLSLPNYKLDTACDYFEIPLGRHHNALDDAIACGKLFNRLNEVMLK